MKTKMTKLLAVPLTAAMMLVCLCGCAPAMPDDAADASFTASAASQPASVSGQTAENDAPSDTPSTGSTAKDRFERAKEQSGSSSQPTAPAEKPEASQSGQTAEDGTPARTPSTGSTVRERFERAKEQAGSNSNSSKPTAPAEKPETSQAGSGYDVEKVSELMSLRADVEKNYLDCTVYVDSEHNPYDITWNYGKDYQKFVDAVTDADMWDVLFDAEFYKESYPMLAMLYHDNDQLLLEQFQTVGVHEGRQGSKAFNVAAYMENCDKSLVDAFGDHYECYYFYWALNQKTESKVSTKSDGHPLQMCVKLTALQEMEFEHVNEYREEAGVDPVKLDPEFLAFANYRAWLDFTGDYTAHDWLKQNADAAYDYLAVMGSETLTENTVCGKCSYGGPSPTAYYLMYYDSPEHYEAMVSKYADYFGCSNAYWGSDNNGKYRHCQYDVYTEGLSTYMNP